jgi:DNA replication and repair protein RecF
MQAITLNHLHILNFKNYSEAEFSFSDKINCLVGNNGVGKTNVLDAIYYLCVSKSYFNPIDSQNISHNTDFFLLEGNFNKGEQADKIAIALKRAAKKSVRRNGKEYERIADHVGHLPLVMISPSDSDLILEGSEVRRRFMDSVISQSDKLYLDDLMAYNRALGQRNSLLKYFAANSKFDADQLALYDEQLIERGTLIYNKRKAFVDVLKPILLSYYGAISGGAEEVSLQYNSAMHERTFEEILHQSLQRDRLVQFTSQGVHRDDLTLTMLDYPLKKAGSQGQQKTFLLALKLAQFDFLKQQSGFLPLLLLDDVFDKLDENRVTALIKLVNAHHFGQIFITDTHPDRTRSIAKRINEESRIFTINQEGRIDETQE